MIRVLALLLAACGPEETGGRRPDGPEPEPGSCAPQLDNVLRWDCTFELEEASPVEVALLDGGAEVGRFDDLTPTDLHHVTLWGLEAEHPYTVRVTPTSSPADAFEESFSTGILPEAVDLVATITGTTTAAYIALPFNCGEAPGHLVVVRASDGAVVWYQDGSVDSELSTAVKVDGFEYDPATGTFQVIMGHLRYRSFDWTGALLADVVRDEDVDRPMHHDAHRAGDHLFSLNAMQHDEPDGSYVMDGVYVFDPTGAVLAEWDLYDQIQPTGGGVGGGYWSLEFPGAVDYTHSNGLFVDDAGDWLLSSRMWNTVLKIRGDLDAPDFGQVLWALTSDEDSPVESDFTLTSTNGSTADLFFNDQHHANLDEQGHLLMFVNGRVNDESRGLEVVLDEAAGTADIVDSWELDVQCPIQGANFRLPSGNVLLTCPSERTFYEFAPGGEEPVFTMTTSCPTGNPRALLVRGQPLSLPR